MFEFNLFDVIFFLFCYVVDKVGKHHPCGKIGVGILSCSKEFLFFCAEHDFESVTFVELDDLFFVYCINNDKTVAHILRC